MGSRFQISFASLRLTASPLLVVFARLQLISSPLLVVFASLRLTASPLLVRDRRRRDPHQLCFCAIRTNDFVAVRDEPLSSHRNLQSKVFKQIKLKQY
jgi:hypothetical protein